MLVLNLDLPVPALDEFGDELHRAGPVQGHERGDMLDGTDLEFFAQFPHPAGFQLEHAERFRPVQEVVGLFVVERQGVNWHFYALGALHHFTGIPDDGQRLEPKKIHF